MLRCIVANVRRQKRLENFSLPDVSISARSICRVRRFITERILLRNGFKLVKFDKLLWYSGRVEAVDFYTQNERKVRYKAVLFLVFASCKVIEIYVSRRKLYRIFRVSSDFVSAVRDFIWPNEIELKAVKIVSRKRFSVNIFHPVFHFTLFTSKKKKQKNAIVRVEYFEDISRGGCTTHDF